MNHRLWFHIIFRFDMKIRIGKYSLYWVSQSKFYSLVSGSISPSCCSFILVKASNLKKMLKDLEICNRYFFHLCNKKVDRTKHLNPVGFGSTTLILYRWTVASIFFPLPRDLPLFSQAFKSGSEQIFGCCWIRIYNTDLVSMVWSKRFLAST